MRIIFFGTGRFGLPSLQALAGSQHELVAVVTNIDKAKGRNLESAASPIKLWALENKKPVIECADINAPGFVEQLKHLNADVHIVISFGFILPEAVLKIPKIITLNLHSSLLPRYRGAAPIHWALINGDAKTGVSVIRVTPRLDSGDILAQTETEIAAADDYTSLENRLSMSGAKILMQSLEKIEKKQAVWTPQQEKNLFYARKLKKEDGRVDWRLSAAAIERKIRALREWPGTFFFYEGKRFIIQEAKVLEAVATQKPGVILQASSEKGIAVLSGNQALQILKLQMEGRKALSAADFLKGFQFKAGQSVE